MNNVKALELVNIVQQYEDKDEPTLKEVNLTVNQGEVVVIYGHNGSGKSSLLNVICNNLPYRGEVFICGEKIDEKSDFPYYKFSYAKQYNSEEHGVCFRSVISELKNGKDIPYESMKEIADYFKCPSLLKQNMASLSGGQKQLVFIMQAFLNASSDIIILDEPINNLDRTRAALLNNYIIDFIKANPTKAIIIVTHCRMFTNTTAYNLDRGVLTALPKNTACATCFGETDENGKYAVDEYTDFSQNKKSFWRKLRDRLF